MRSVVRAFVFNSEGEILMTRHKPGSPWVLPGGHVEIGESLHRAMMRELQEEFGISAGFFEIDNEENLSHRGEKLPMNPLPISSYDLSYRDSEGKDKSRTEYVFLMELAHSPLGSSPKRGMDVSKDWWNHLQTQKEEIAEYAWIEPEKILSMKPNIETWDFYQQILEKIIGDEELGE